MRNRLLRRLVGCVKLGGSASAGTEKCESGRIGLTANELTWETGSEGSNPSFSARRNVAGGPQALQ